MLPRYLLILILAAAPVRPALAQLTNENLLVAVPSGYKVGFQDHKPNMQMTEMVPESESVDNWTEMVTVQVFYRLKATPDGFAKTMADGWLKDCPGSTASLIASGPENGYPAAVWLLNCSKNPATGKPEITWVKTIQGNDSFYVVQKAFKFMPSKDQIGQWMKYLRAVIACDSRLADRACPQTKN